MANITRAFAVPFGSAYTGLSTVGYTLTGGSRVTAGVTELVAGTGTYGATVTYTDTLAGSITWDTGGVPLVTVVYPIVPEAFGEGSAISVADTTDPFGAGITVRGS